MWTAAEVLAFRKERGQNQADFARDVGVDRVTVSGWERGAAVVSPLSAAQLDKLKQGRVPETQAPDAYWRGVYFAAEAMTVTVGQLLRQAREAGEANAAPPADAAIVTQLATAHAQTPASNTGSLRPKTGATNRRTGGRRGGASSGGA